MESTADSDEAVPSLAQRLDTLFKTKLKTEGKDRGKEYSNREVSRILSARGEPISHTYIGELRSGQHDDPRISHLRALAGFFGVDVEFFTSDEVAAKTSRELEMAAKLKQLKVQTVALRQSVLPEAEQTLAALQSIVDAIRTLEADDGDTTSRDDT
jgi:transcriptional regulator with XRE-family HTH domain